MVEKSRVVNDRAKNAVIRKDREYVRLVPHPSLARTWIEIDITEANKREHSSIGLKRASVSHKTSAEVLQEVSDFIDIPVKDICQKTRKRTILEPRQVAMYMAEKLTNESLAEIGWCMGRKDHATVLHACKTVKNLLKTDKKYREKWKQLTDS